MFLLMGIYLWMVMLGALVLSGCSNETIKAKSLTLEEWTQLVEWSVVERVKECDKKYPDRVTRQLRCYDRRFSMPKGFLKKYPVMTKTMVWKCAKMYSCDTGIYWSLAEDCICHEILAKSVRQDKIKRMLADEQKAQRELK